MEEPIHCECVCTAVKSVGQNVSGNPNARVQVIGQAPSQFTANNSDEEKVKQATGVLNWFKEYIGTHEFNSEVKRVATKYCLPEKAVATNFFEKVLGTIGDIFGIVFGTIEGFCHTLLGVAGAVARGIVNTICGIGRAIGRVVTLNKTAVTQ